MASSGLEVLVGEAEGADPTRRWIVDPLDGTTNFLHGMPHWAVSIALEHKGEIVSAVVYDPAKDEMFWAEKGVGAYCSSKRLRVSARTDLSECLIATGLPFKGSKKNDVNVIKEVSIVMSQVAGIRRAGSAAGRRR